ncbi:terminase small subunit [Lactococcus allomyrinae]|uniref:terminase small subunit n=1 Tax=Lactococcus allomyrinae TaxID=2419773 RepID=UPI0013C4A29A|nr:terminase small subunit [Lactococcus allomyrinae]
MGLRQQHKNFAQRYRETGNATQSYIDAGYKARGHSAESAAQRLLSNVEVQKYLQTLNNKSEKKSIATADEIMDYLSSVMRGETTETVVMMAQKTGRVVSIDKTPDESTRIRAATELLKRYPSVVTDSDNTVRIIFDGIKESGD